MGLKQSGRLATEQCVCFKAEVLEELRNKLVSDQAIIPESVTEIKLLVPPGGILPEEE